MNSSAEGQFDFHASLLRAAVCLNEAINLVRRGDEILLEFGFRLTPQIS